MVYNEETSQQKRFSSIPQWLRLIISIFIQSFPCCACYFISQLWLTFMETKVLLFSPIVNTRLNVINKLHSPAHFIPLLTKLLLQLQEIDLGVLDVTFWWLWLDEDSLIAREETKCLDQQLLPQTKFVKSFKSSVRQEKTLFAAGPVSPVKNIERRRSMK